MNGQDDADRDDTMNVSAQVNRAFLEEFDRAIKKAQIEGEIPMDVSRAKVIRGLMKLGVEDSALIGQAVVKDEEEA